MACHNKISAYIKTIAQQECNLFHLPSPTQGMHHYFFHHI
jgi:hypothetical protein